MKEAGPEQPAGKEATALAKETQGRENLLVNLWFVYLFVFVSVSLSQDEILLFKSYNGTLPRQAVSKETRMGVPAKGQTSVHPTQQTALKTYCVPYYVLVSLRKYYPGDFML